MTDFEKLQALGNHKIYEDTHITKKFVQDILDKNFSSMTKVQFSGFIKIFEREYKLNLEELREEFGITKELKVEKKVEPFTVNAVGGSSGVNLKVILIVLAVLIFIIFGIYLSLSPSKVEVNSTTTQEEINKTVDISIVADAKENLNNLDKKDTIQEVVVEEEVVSEPIHPVNLKIIPSQNIWIGIVNLETFKRSQKLGKIPFELDAEKDWLLVTGHSYISFDINGEEKSFASKDKAWFSYESGVLTKLTRSQFKEKNRGKAW